jgi:signal peptidase
LTTLAEHPVRMNRARRGNRQWMRVRIKRTWEIVSLLLVIGACIFWAMFLRPQSLGGSAAYILVSGESMEPLYHTGDLILVERSKAYAVGDIIAYRVPKADPMAGAQVIHRIIGGNATRGFLVQGDNRTAPDVWRPKPSDVVGSAHLRIPHAAVGLQFVRSPLLLGLLAASFVFVYALTGRNKEHDSDAGADAPAEATADDIPITEESLAAPHTLPPKQIALVAAGEPRTRATHAGPPFLRSPSALGLLILLFVLACLLFGKRRRG